MTEHIKNYLNALHTGIFNCLETLFDLLDADTVETDFSSTHEVVKYPKNFGPVIDFRWRTVKLEEVDGIGLKVF